MKVKHASLEEFTSAIPRLAALLIDAVEHDAGVSFLKPLEIAVAENFWRDLLPAIEQQRTVALVAEDSDEIKGVVLLSKAWAENQWHRCEISKLLVDSRFRKQSIGKKLMQAAETLAKSWGKTLITLDAVAHGGVEEFYKKLGFKVAGYYPKYAYSGLGKLDDTCLFYKEL